MKKKRVWVLFLIVLTLTLILPESQVQAQVHSISDLSVEITVADDVICLTSDTPSTDEQWSEAGITDVSSEKDDFSDMGVQALFYDPSTGSTVRLLKKQSTESKEIFNLSLLSEDELQDFLTTIADTSDSDTTSSIEEYPQEELPFFRLSIDTTQDGTTLSEIAYGTVVNGSLLWFDIYVQNPTESIDETFIQELVAGTHFTEFLDKAEAQKEERIAILRFCVFLVLVIALIVFLILYNKKKSKKLRDQTKKRSEALSLFYKQRNEQKQTGSELSRTLIYENHTTYTESLIKEFTYYDTFLKKIYFWLLSAGLYLILVGYFYITGGVSLSFVLSIILLIAFCYAQGFKADKTVQIRWKLYDSAKNKEAIFRFYDDYFTMSGIQYLSEYPYTQITEIKQHKDHIYLYFGTEKAVYLSQDSFIKDNDAFMTFIKEKLQQFSIPN